MKAKITKKRVTLLMAALFAVATIGVSAYLLFEARGLRARMHTVENRVNDMGVVYDGAADNATAGYEEISKEPKTIRVVDTSNLTYKYNAEPEIMYVNKQVMMYTIRITNDTDWQHSYTEGYIKGKTKTGKLVEPIFVGDIHPNDLKGEGILNLAPGGQGEVNVFLPVDQGITELYFDTMNGAV